MHGNNTCFKSCSAATLTYPFSPILFHLNFWLYICVFHINFLKSPCGLNPPLSCLKQYASQGQMNSS